MASQDIRLSGPALKVLKLFVDAPREVLSGYQIAKTASISSGTLYPILARLENAGWLSSAWEDIDPSEAGRPRRRYYRMTALGQNAALDALAPFQVSNGVLGWNT